MYGGHSSIGGHGGRVGRHSGGSGCGGRHGGGGDLAHNGETAAEGTTAAAVGTAAAAVATMAALVGGHGGGAAGTVAVGGNGGGAAGTVAAADTVAAEADTKAAAAGTEAAAAGVVAVAPVVVGGVFVWVCGAEGACEWVAVKSACTCADMGWVRIVATCLWLPRPSEARLSSRWRGESHITGIGGAHIHAVGSRSDGSLFSAICLSRRTTSSDSRCQPIVGLHSHSSARTAREPILPPTKDFPGSRTNSYELGACSGRVRGVLVRTRDVHGFFYSRKRSRVRDQLGRERHEFATSLPRVRREFAASSSRDRDRDTRVVCPSSRRARCEHVVEHGVKPGPTRRAIAQDSGDSRREFVRVRREFAPSWGVLGLLAAHPIVSPSTLRA